MPRPQPIIIPGPTGMGGRSTFSDIQIPVGDILKLVNFFQQQNANKAAGADMLKMLGMDSQPVATMTQEPMIGSTEEGVVNMPATMNTPDYSAMGRSPEGRSVLADLIKTNLGSKEKDEKWVIGTQISPDDNKLHSYQIYPNGRKVDLGLAGEDSKTGKYQIGGRYQFMDPKTQKLTEGTYQGPDKTNEPIFSNTVAVQEPYKAPRPIGRGGVSRRTILQDPNSGALYYQDSMLKGTKEEVPTEDSQYMRPITVRGIEAGQASELASMKNTFNRLTDVAGKAEKLQDKFGPLSGRFTSLKNKFMEDGPSQQVLNELKSMITIAYSLSGKQISIQEMQMLQDAILPTLNQPYGNFLETLKFARDWVGKTHDDRIDSFQNAFFDVKEPYLVRGKEKDKLSFPENEKGKAATSGRFTIKEVK